MYFLDHLVALCAYTGLCSKPCFICFQSSAILLVSNCPGCHLVNIGIPHNHTSRVLRAGLRAGIKQREQKILRNVSWSYSRVPICLMWNCGIQTASKWLSNPDCMWNVCISPEFQSIQQHRLYGRLGVYNLNAISEH